MQAAGCAPIKKDPPTSKTARIGKYTIPDYAGSGIPPSDSPEMMPPDTESKTQEAEEGKRFKLYDVGKDKKEEMQKEEGKEKDKYKANSCKLTTGGCWSDTNGLLKTKDDYCPACEKAGCPPAGYVSPATTRGPDIDETGYPKSEVLPAGQLSTYTGASTLPATGYNSADHHSGDTKLPLAPDIVSSTADAVNLVGDIAEGKKSIKFEDGQWTVSLPEPKEKKDKDKEK
ncbi:hypothetical protein QBC43DRAFT_338978 [Cladorrhinum sp. PSN259]|nr:hypothetical protein QBC43DRAFT_338978 [Cladorrhinum sp. PSN259]